nr:SusC/RagA family TonB-linked outer membrane protein [Salinivirgaceae bacterium]
YTISSKLKFYSDIMYTRYDQDASYDYEDWGGYDEEKSLRSMAYRKMPNLSVYTRDTNNVTYADYFNPSTTLQTMGDNTSSADMPNPVAFANLAKHKRYKDNVRAGFTLNYKISEKLTANTILTLDVFDAKMEKYLPSEAVGVTSRRAISEFKNKSTIFSKTLLIYAPLATAVHDLKFLGQFDAELTKQRAYKITTRLGFSEYETSTIGDKTIAYNGLEASLSEYKSAGFFGNVMYKLNDKYIFSAGAKLEGNSKYSRESRWGIFPAATVAWRISKEPFMNWSNNFINDFKFRGSWGISGNAPEDDYLYYNTYDAGVGYNYMNMSGIIPNNMELTALQWENIEQFNLGLSFYAIKNRLNIEFDIYEKTTHNLYHIKRDTYIPTTTGFSQFDTNDGKLQNKGVEASLDYKVIQRGDFTFSFNFNISQNKNIVLELPDNFNFEYGDMTQNSNYKIAIVPGQAIGGFFGYNFQGVYSTTDETYVRDANGNLIYGIGETDPMQMIHGGPEGYEYEAGDSKYEDRNYDGKIDELDIIFLGDTNPDFMGGFGPRVSYKGLTANMFIFYRVGHEVINQTRMDTEKMYDYDNQSTATNRRWRGEGDVTQMPRALFDEGFNWLGSSRFVEDGSFVRLKSASITYKFPKTITKKLKVNVLKAYLTGYNLYTWTGYSGQDPDVGLPGKPSELPKDQSRTPPSIRYTFGISVSF